MGATPTVIYVTNLGRPMMIVTEFMEGGSLDKLLKVFCIIKHYAVIYYTKYYFKKIIIVYIASPGI